MLSPYLEREGFLRIGGQLKNATIDFNKKFPLIIPRHWHVARLNVEHYHD